MKYKILYSLYKVKKVNKYKLVLELKGDNLDDEVILIINTSIPIDIDTD